MMKDVLTYGMVVILMVGLSFVIGLKCAEAEVVGAWLFDEGSGNTAADSSGRGVDGVIVGEPEWVAGQFGGALKLEPEKYVDFPPPLSEMMILERDFSCIAWVYANEWISGYQAVMSMQAGSSNGETYGFYFDKGGERITIYINLVGGGQNLKTDLGTVELATWIHVALTYDGSQLTIYLNGEVAAQKDMSGDQDIKDGLGRFVINGNYNALDGNLSEWVSVTVDEVLVFDNAVPQNEIQGYMNNGFAPSAAVEPAEKLTTTWGELKAY